MRMWKRFLFFLVWAVMLLVLICNHDVFVTSRNIPFAGSRERKASNVVRSGVKMSVRERSRDPSGEPDVSTVASEVRRVEEEEEGLVGSRLRARRGLVQKVCRKYNPPANLNTTVRHRDYYFHHHNTTVCLLAKAGSSSWRDHLRRVNGGPPRHLPLLDDESRRQLLALPTLDLLRKVNATVKIITVRHPLTRLVSCYRQKYKDGRQLPRYIPHPEGWHSKKASSSWAEKVRQFWVPALRTNHLLPPDLHLRLGLQKPLDPKILYDAKVYIKMREILRPHLSFIQFLQHVVASFTTSPVDAHWSDYNTECSPCYFDYLYVTKVETMSEDLEFVFKAVGIPSDANVVLNKKRSSVDTSEGDFEYYKDVPVDLRRKIYLIYKMDFEMYDYELPKWFLDEE